MKMFPKKKETASLPPAAGAKSKAAPNFMEVVYGIVRRIPKGRATSYGAIAEASGIRLTARMVGWAMNAAGRANPPVPAHRVVNSKGELSGRAHFATPTLMQELLEQEGIAVKNDKIEHFNTVFWNPAAPSGKRASASGPLPGKQQTTTIAPATKAMARAAAGKPGPASKPAAAKKKNAPAAAAKKAGTPAASKPRATAKTAPKPGKKTPGKEK